MNVERFLELKPAPRAVFDDLDARRDRVRFMVPTGDDWEAVTWGAFATRIRRAGAWLAANGFESGERAVVFAPNSVAWGAAALAIQGAGGVMVPVYPGCTAEQAAYIIDHADARVVFVDTALLLGRLFEAWEELGGVRRVVLLDPALDARKVHSDLAAGDPSLVPFERIAPRLERWDTLQRAHDEADLARFDARLADLDLDAPGLMLYTSGTTGNPKGVPLTHRNVGVNGADWLGCFAPILEEEMTDLLWLPMSHIFGFGELCLGNTLGWTTWMSDPVSVLERLPEVRPSVFMSVPVYWEKLAILSMSADDPAARLRELTGGKLRVCLSGGAGLKKEIKDRYAEAGMLVIEGYGLTEAAPTLTLNRPDDYRFDSVGKPLPSVELKLAPDGEILARGPNIFSGYHKDPAATAEVLDADGWLHTGDVGRFTEDGFLRIVDRKKDILVTAGGKNVPPANIEQRFADDPFIAHLVVYGDGKKYLVAGVWLNPPAVDAWLEEHGGTAHDLVRERIEKVNAGLPRYETVKTFFVANEPLSVDNQLLTASLKVRRRQVYERFAADFEGLYEAPVESQTPRAEATA